MWTAAVWREDASGRGESTRHGPRDISHADRRGEGVPCSLIVGRLSKTTPPRVIQVALGGGALLRVS